jgi:hypothetical protein
MRGRVTLLVAAVVSLLTACALFESPGAKPEFEIQYPVHHYLILKPGEEPSGWRQDVAALRERLSILYPGDAVQVTLPEGLDPVDIQQNATAPARVVVQDPRFFFRKPAVLYWWEVTDESGRVLTVYVIASNQSRENDRRLLRWLVRDKLKGADGNPSTTVRSASIDLRESKFHSNFWKGQLADHWFLVLTITAGSATLLVYRYKDKKKRAAERKERLHRLTTKARPLDRSVANQELDERIAPQPPSQDTKRR